MNTMTPTELLASVERWLWTWALKAARKIPGRLYDADDLHAEMAMKVLKSAHTYDPAKGKPSTWASYVCMSVTHTIQRKIFAVGDVHALTLDDELPCDELSYFMPSDDERDDHDCVSRIADELLASLDDDRREAVIEEHYRGNPYGERPQQERLRIQTQARSGVNAMRRHRLRAVAA